MLFIVAIAPEILIHPGLLEADDASDSDSENYSDVGSMEDERAISRFIFDFLRRSHQSSLHKSSHISICIF